MLMDLIRWNTLCLLVSKHEEQLVHNSGQSGCLTVTHNFWFHPLDELQRNSDWLNPAEVPVKDCQNMLNHSQPTNTMPWSTIYFGRMGLSKVFKQYFMRRRIWTNLIFYGIRDAFQHDSAIKLPSWDFAEQWDVVLRMSGDRLHRSEKWSPFFGSHGP